MGSLVRATEILVQETRIGLHHFLEGRGRHGRSRRRNLQHPERRRRVRVFLRLTHRDRESPQRSRHPVDRLIDRRVFMQVDPRNAQVRRVRESPAGNLAALESPCQLDIATVQHIVTISYYPLSSNWPVDRGEYHSTSQ